MVAFRGTESVRDYGIDLSPGLMTVLGGEVHDGFYRAFMSLWQDGTGSEVQEIGHPCAKTPSSKGLGSVLRDELVEKLYPIYFTGHSLGGALASLAFLESQSTPGMVTTRPDTDHVMQEVAAADTPGLPVAAAYTFGAPRVGNKDLANRIAYYANQHASFFRVVNATDGVPAVPSSSSFTHPTRTGDESNFLVFLTVEGTVDIQGSRGEYAVDRKVPLTFWDLVGDHKVAKYEAKLRALAYAE